MSDQQRGHPIALSVRKIALRDGANKGDFEKFMLEELFPTLDTSEEGFEPDQHFLLQEDWPSDVYVWMSRLEYWVHHTPFPMWLSNRLDAIYEGAQERLEPFGTYTTDPLEVYFDVASMGGRFAF